METRTKNINNLQRTAYLVTAVALAWLLCTPFVSGDGLARGMVTGQLFWVHLGVGLLSIATCLVVLVSRGGGLRVRLTDWCVGLLALLVTEGYDFVLDAEPVKLRFFVAIVLSYALLRVLFSCCPRLMNIALLGLMMTAGVEALWGLGQLFGEVAANHSLFRMTGSFYNPGPYSGYLAMMLPICLGLFLRARDRLEQSSAFFCLFLVIVLLPAGMSRTAWIAAAFGGGWTLWMHRVGWQRSREFFVAHKRLLLPIGVGTVVLGSLLIYALYHYKADSALGRLLLWELTAKAANEHPLFGAGLGNFPAAYAEAQAELFASGAASATEKWVAGAPEYAFNEYLQVALEFGYVGLLLMLATFGSAIYYGVRARNIEAVGAVIVLMVFAFASYPLQLPSFWIALIVLIAVAVSTGSNKDCEAESSKPRLQLIALSIAITTLSISLIVQQADYFESYRKWNNAKGLYHAKAYKTAIEEFYGKEHRLDHEVEFLFEKAQCYAKSNDHNTALHSLERAIRLTADPMVHYVAARSQQELGQFKEAEETLLHAINILPERIYPHYLLVKLYADPRNYQPKKLKQAAYTVLRQKPKVESPATREMKEEVRKILEESEKKLSVKE